ncbi:ABC transporter substrate-binding protein [Photobacterium angustum]|uniref:ABC transporter permease n=1 Tax=Photobacterium angustum TaxID=661 RepID=UPI0005DEF70A|nr:ABC transporter permease [Photobacterium angustum]KJF94065.1 ABC transporter substrate-binding protein [Photobacterium angustum]KJG06004.1 ABC transporter substrate-binding protein [Photobacterium angustum]PSV92497.1 ABC transporter permease [Photobacterium angustum]PSW82627.1 ABC transporter permease [Photobacterium angustum]
MITLLNQTVQTLLTHRLRSALAIIAIVWGIVSVLVLVALGEGFYREHLKSFSMLMSDTQKVSFAQTSKPWQGYPSRRKITATESQLSALSDVHQIKHVSILYSNAKAQVTDIDGTQLKGNVFGIDNHFLALNNTRLELGSRKISPSDLANHTRVAIIGWRLAKRGNIRLNDKININGIPFQVIGISKKTESSGLTRIKRAALIPTTTFNDLWLSNPSDLLVQPAKGISSVALRAAMQNFFAKKYQFDPKDKQAVQMPDFSRFADFYTSLLRGIQLFLGASGAMTLAVGALGVANIMFLSVAERTREIGVRLAIGATPTHILMQFMVEGAVLVTVGALCGIIVSTIIIQFLNLLSLPDWLGHPVMTSTSIVFTLMITAVLALLAAFFPARRAAHLTPVIALSARA